MGVARALKLPAVVMRRLWGRLTERDYHVAILVFLSVFIFAFVANS